MYRMIIKGIQDVDSKKTTIDQEGNIVIPMENETKIQQRLRQTELDKES